MRIYENIDDSAPCKDCVNYGDGTVYENGEDFHEFTCSGGFCLYCAESNNFSCFETYDEDNEDF